jgi:hypothetical protein
MQIHAADGDYGSTLVVGNIHELVALDDPSGERNGKSTNGTNGHHSSVAPRKPR